MTDIYKTPEKASTKYRLFAIGIDYLRQEGWQISKIQGFGKSSVRQITKGSKTLKVTIKTSQDTWLAFARDQDNKKWATLADVDIVLVVSVDDQENPTFANVHWMKAKEIIERFDRAFAARKKAGHTIPLDRGIWLSLYRPEADEPVNRIGGGIGIAHPAKMTVPLKSSDMGNDTEPPIATADSTATDDADDEAPLTIGDAKRRLAKTFGVEPSSIKITVEA
jgi:hypothetical protein